MRIDGGEPDRGALMAVVAVLIGLAVLIHVLHGWLVDTAHAYPTTTLPATSTTLADLP